MPGHWPAPLKREFPTAASGFSPQLCHALLGIFIPGHLFLRLLGQLADSLMKTSVLRSLIGGYPFPPVPQLFLAFPPMMSHSFIHQASFMEGPPTGTGPLLMSLPGSSPCSLHNFNLIAQKPNPREWSWPQPPTWNSCRSSSPLWSLFREKRAWPSCGLCLYTSCRDRCELSRARGRCWRGGVGSGS